MENKVPIMLFSISIPNLNSKANIKGWKVKGAHSSSLTDLRVNPIPNPRIATNIAYAHSSECHCFAIFTYTRFDPGKSTVIQQQL